jgi:hypothetical protein
MLVRARLLSRGTASRLCSTAADPYPSGLDDTIVVYGRPTSRVQKVHNTLAELDLPWEAVNFQKAPDWYKREINPTGLVPSIRCGQQVLWGSNSE